MRMLPALLLSLLVCACGLESPYAEPPGGGVGGKADQAGGTSGVRLPIVLVHAFHATARNSWSMQRVAAVLRGAGDYVVLADLPRYGSTPDRARVLLPQLDAARRAFCADRLAERDADACFEQTRVHLIGHSQGGLDARYVVSRLGYGAHTASVTTIGAPHRGTPLGDWGMALLASVSITVAAPLFGGLLGDLSLVVRSDLFAALYWLSESRYLASLDPRSSAAMPDVPGVAYLSWAGVATTDGELPAGTASACKGLTDFPQQKPGQIGGVLDALRFKAVSGAFTEPRHSPNDGHIPVRSARYRDFMGCVPADHLELVGRPASHDAATIAQSGFDYRALYRRISRQLAAIAGRAAR